MNSELTEEEMRGALFGGTDPVTQGLVLAQKTVPEISITSPTESAKQKQAVKAFTPRLRVTLRVGNEFEGKMHEIVHETDTLSTLLAEQMATRAARKKFRYIEVVSVKPM